jgi:hypothetical protein
MDERALAALLLLYFILKHDSRLDNPGPIINCISSMDRKSRLLNISRYLSSVKEATVMVCQSLCFYECRDKLPCTSYSSLWVTLSGKTVDLPRTDSICVSLCYSLNKLTRVSSGTDWSTTSKAWFRLSRKNDPGSLTAVSWHPRVGCWLEGRTPKSLNPGKAEGM